ncbi:MAG: type IV pilus assembly protein PilM [Gemmatimonadota bacterium]|nr:type IV pilus assembly protein PilM [Gemmatimonadota bacterium]
MQLPFSKSKSIVGLDIGSSSVKVVEAVTRSRGGIDLVHVGQAKLPPEAIVQGAFLNSSAIVDAIQEAMDKAGVKSKSVAAAVAGHAVIVKKISLPEMTRDELEESIRWEAEQYIPFDINEVNLDFQILEGSESEGQMDVLLVAAKKDLIDDYVHVITDAGLTPAVVDVAAFAVANAWEANYPVNPDEVVALVNIGSQVVNINILSGGVPAFTRDINTGGNAYTEEIQKALSVSWDEAERMKLGGSSDADAQEVVPEEVEQAMRSVTETVISEISRSLDFFAATAAESRIARVYLSGGGSCVSGLDAAFQGKTNLPVERLNPLARAATSSKFDADYLDEVGPSLAVSVGLALRRMDD